MSTTRTIEGTRQILGRRLGLEPYYVVAECSEGQLRLVSRPEANKAQGRGVMAGGAAMLLVAVAVAVSGLTSAATGAGFGVGAMAAAIAGLLGSLGYQRAMGGYALLTTRNSIVCDSEAGTITYRQGSKVGAERVQTLAVSQVRALRLRRRPLATGWPLRRVRPIVAIELLVGEQIWLADTAADPEALRPAAEGLSQALRLDFVRSE